MLDDAAEGQGLAAWGKDWTQKVNTWVLPETTTFRWSTNDLRDQKLKADVAKARADTRGAQVKNGEITAAESRQLAVDSNDLPREFIAKDLTAAGDLGDDEKALAAPTETEGATAAPSPAPAAPAPAAAAAPVLVPVSKALPQSDTLVAEQLDRARALFAEVHRP